MAWNLIYRSSKILHSYFYIETALELEYVSSMVVNLRKYFAYLCFRRVFTPYILWNFRCHFVENDIQTQWRKHVTKLLVTPNVSLLLYREWHKTWVWKHDSHSGRNWTFFHVKIRSLLQKKLRRIRNGIFKCHHFNIYTEASLMFQKVLEKLKNQKYFSCMCCISRKQGFTD